MKKRFAKWVFAVAASGAGFRGLRRPGLGPLAGPAKTPLGGWESRRNVPESLCRRKKGRLVSRGEPLDMFYRGAVMGKH